MELQRRYYTLPRQDLRSKEPRTTTRSSQVMPRTPYLRTPRTIQDIRNCSIQFLVARHVCLHQELRRGLRDMRRNKEHHPSDSRTLAPDRNPRYAVRNDHHGLYHRPPILERIRRNPRVHRQMHQDNHTRTMYQDHRHTRNRQTPNGNDIPTLRNAKENYIRPRTPVRITSNENDNRRNGHPHGPQHRLPPSNRRSDRTG